MGEGRIYGLVGGKNYRSCVSGCSMGKDKVKWER